MCEVKLFASPSYREASSLAIAEICNGCGTKGFGGWIVPDTLWGLDIHPACEIHDWDYFMGETDEDKRAADRILLNNMLRIIHAKTKNPILKALRIHRAQVYYHIVRLLGGLAFWDNKNTPADMVTVELS